MSILDIYWNDNYLLSIGAELVDHASDHLVVAGDHLFIGCLLAKKSLSLITPIRQHEEPVFIEVHHLVKWDHPEQKNYGYFGGL
jgi:hypothetical protein